ncbi:hypothetical protein BDW02DRAFT_597577 [Decorospora gaudefroyi]|uniref:Uncharacterized protein n=1 Tax=Decorospora gaudefroyi TaxID=184978 RepID=A0A6A5KGR4_9PLEO|nr:hypothetical protein BDW02DRAFT_597577 [Decorospora gaudefroyi]
MNWTGGSLQRTKKANTGVLQQQRAYFAKARTHLQNTTNSPGPPFRPSYLRDNEDFGAMRASFGSGSVRHVGHPAKRSGARRRRKPSPDNRRSDIGYDELSTHESSPTHFAQFPPSQPSKQKHAKEELRGEECQAIDVSAETRLLEANRKRLLTQQDWIGIDPSKPVSLRFLSSKDKDKIGKRRRITGKHAATLKQKNDTVLRPHLRRADERFTGASERGATRNVVEDIRIRIGTDALTNTCSAQPNEYTQSHASSEPMLFDQEGPATQPQAGETYFAPLVNPQLSATISAYTPTSAAPHAPPTGESPQRCRDDAQLHMPVPSHDAFEQGISDDEPAELHVHDGTAKHQSCESSPPGFLLTHRLHGHDRALRLVFGDFNSSAGGRSRIVSGDRVIGEMQPREPTSARASGIAHMHQISNDREQSVIEEASAVLEIVDPEPWRKHFAISDGGSSRSETDVLSRNGMLHDNPTMQNNNEAVTNWSQHATQGDQSHISPSSISASLPSLKRGVKRPRSTRPNEEYLIHRDGSADIGKRILDEDEKNWQAFVFGSDGSSCSQMLHDNAHGSLQMIAKDSDNTTSSRYLPFSAAVSSVSSVPINTAGPRFGSYVRNVTQDPAASARPWSTFHGYAEELGEDGYDEDIPKSNALGQQSVTHASLENNASSDLIFPRIFSGTKTSRSGLDQSKVAGGASYTQAIASARRPGRSFEGPSSPHDIPVSDDDPLDLVDPDKMW